jgi:predicted nucleotidyltransferase
MTRDAPEAAARALVAERHPDAIQAWLAGSTTTGHATETSDLDITVLIDQGEVHRASVQWAGWRVELFVHTAASIEYFVAKDLQRRRPTMARLVASGVPLRGVGVGWGGGDGGHGGDDVRRRCEEVLARGPGPVTPEDLELMRYGLTDLLDDLTDDRPTTEVTAVAVNVWRATAELALAEAEAWSGTGKWLVRELRDLDARQGTTLALELDAALRGAVTGDREVLLALSERVLERCGGRYWAGLYRAAELP